MTGENRSHRITLNFIKLGVFMLNTVHKQWQDETGVLSNNGLIKSISLYRQCYTKQLTFF